jgi:hypothetical protein
MHVTQCFMMSVPYIYYALHTIDWLQQHVYIYDNIRVIYKSVYGF